jgi:hypothetical protein
VILGTIIVHDTVVAIRTGTLVALGRSDRGGLYWPPFISGPIGVFALLLGIWVLSGLLLKRKRK